MPRAPIDTTGERQPGSTARRGSSPATRAAQGLAQERPMARDNTAPRRMTLVAFLQAANCSNYPASWRHPATAPDFLTAAYFQRIAWILEEGKFHLAFCDDRLAMPDRYGDDFATAVQHGIRVVKMDLIPVLTAMGLATRHLGLGSTYSTTYYEPFHVARVFATLDH